VDRAVGDREDPKAALPEVLPDADPAAFAVPVMPDTLEVELKP
jgi:hypothetical protein